MDYAKRKKLAKLHLLIMEIENLMGWRGSEALKGRAKLPIGVLIGNDTFFEELEVAENED